MQNAEKKIEKLEGEIEAFEAKMADPSFYENPDSQKQMEQYGQKKKDLEQAMEDWEAAQEVLDEYES